MIALLGLLRQDELRLFPPVGPALYASSNEEHLSPDQRAARQVLDLAAAPCRGRMRYGWWLTPSARLQRLLHFHRAALHADLDGKPGRAAACWAEVVRELRALPEASPAWAELAARLGQDQGVAVLNDPAQLRRRLIDEVLIDSLCGLFNGQVEGQEELRPQNRAPELAAGLEMLLPHCGLDADTRRQLHERAVLACVAGLEKARQWDRAIALAQRLMATYPDRLSYQERVSDLIFSKAMAGATKTDSEALSLQQAAALAWAGGRLEAFRVRHPYCADCYDSLSALHYLRAVKLANAGRLSEALLAVEEALTYRPDSNDVLDTRTQLEQMMRSVQRQMHEATSRLGNYYAGYGRRVTTTLSAKGLELQREADAGFGPRDRYRRRQPITALVRPRQIARGRRLWERIGLAAPADNWDDRAARLDEGVALLLARKPETNMDLLLGWTVLQAERPELRLAEFDLGKVYEFFSRDHSEPDRPEGAPVLVTPPPRAPDFGPFDLWLVRPRDLGFKATVTACLLLLVGGLLLFRQAAHGRHERDEAFAELKKAASRFDDQAAVAAADRFVAAPFAAGDARLKTVRQVRAAAPGWPDRRALDAAYERLLRAAQTLDSAAARKAAAAFRTNRHGQQDPRCPQVVQIAEQAADWPNRRERDRAYDALVAAARAGDDKTVLAEGERFLQVEPPGPEPRTEQVKELMAQAAEAPNRRARDRAYERLIGLMPDVLGEANKKDEEALKAAADFLAARTTWGGPDPRLKQIDELRQVILAAPRRRQRDAAYRKLTAAARQGQPGEATVLREAKAFADGLADGETDPRDEQVRRLADLAREGPNLRLRDEAYARLLDAVKRKDEVAAARAVADFGRARPIKLADPRAATVTRAEELAAEWPRERARDDAYSRLKTAVPAGRHADVLGAAEQFLGNLPRREDDPRTGQVRDWYAAAFVRWFATPPEGKEAQERAERYKNLTEQSAR
jgi:hypothetical protein